MKLNYQVFTHPRGECFSLPAKDDSEAKALVEDYLKETEQFRAQIHPWDEKNHKYDYSDDKRVDIAIEEKPSQQSIEYKIETRYIKWVKCSGTTTEDAFYEASKTIASSLDTLPEFPGWEKNFSSQPVHYTDDERRGVQVIEEILVR